VVSTLTGDAGLKSTGEDQQGVDTNTTPPGATVWRVKYDGPCARCGTLLRKGTPAVWDRPTKTMHCVACPAEELAAAELPLAELEAMAPSPPAPTEPNTVALDTGIAGGSARHEYERRRDKRQDEVKGRWGNRLGGLILALNNEPQSTRAWAIGARGEEKLAKALAKVEGVRFLHDRRVPGTKGNIDHLVIGPTAVFVVDAKNYLGTVDIVDKGGFFRTDKRLYVGRRDCSHLAIGMTWQVEAVAKALHGAGVEPVPPIKPVLCFIDSDWPLLFPPDSFAGVRLESTQSIRRLVTAKGDLDPERIDELTALLAEGLPAK